MRVPVAEKARTEKPDESPGLEVTDIFHRYGEQYRAKHKLTAKQHQVMCDIENCRTSHLGYHVHACTDCDYVDYWAGPNFAHLLLSC
ncbi:MAG: hypothetical protein HKP58_00830 [Desulfatitalea sp.]|nr:transposase zinc-binding domain-containing protein [Desulfatitalea sp.]NNJ98930.1 hypothetical protein [Desulfatitalea sp.]